MLRNPWKFKSELDNLFDVLMHIQARHKDIVIENCCSYETLINDNGIHNENLHLTTVQHP